MSDTLFKVKQIASLIVFIGVLSLMGMMTNQPIMVLAYAGFFMAVVAVMLILMRKRQRHTEIAANTSTLFPKIVGGVLMAVALITPLLIALRTNVINLPVDMSLGAAIGIVGGTTLLFIALMLGAVYFINMKGIVLSNRIIGYALFVIGAALPGILMSRVDGTTSGIGSVYYVAMAVLILAYNGYGYLTKQD
ncbi:MAG: hypothetical protein PHO32_06515 [Candidatus Cloacimonetes bacterium]|nr:hypothetical protein [Candidatus Cloacimonadota bacterium]